MVGRSLASTTTLQGVLVQAAASFANESVLIGTLKLTVIIAQLALILAVVARFHLESTSFVHVGILACAAFAVHCYLPRRWRLSFFAAVSLASIGLVFGAWGGAWLIGLGLALIVVCHLPIPFGLRVAVLLAMGAGLAACRGGLVEVAPTTLPSAIWPILGSMFMLRLIVYLYDLRFATKRPGIAETLAYFFMLPNVCFPLYPIVDFRTFQRTYYDAADEFAIYQRGIRWMFRGVVHLILYRLIYLNCVVGVEQVETPADLVGYLFWPFLLYLRVSGDFHLIVGMLHLFGFHLPETHHLYYLASSFNDFWRRINIYWKDFMMKVFYYPVFFRLRRLGMMPALILSTCLVFFATWVLHAYQWFWIRGTLLLTWNDALFWALLGGLVVVNTVYETRFGRARSLEGHASSARANMGLALRTVATFTTICLLWSFWSADSVAEWLSAWSVLASPAADYSFVLLLAVALIGLGISAVWFARRPSEPVGDFWPVAMRGAVALVLLAIFSVERVATQFGPLTSHAVRDLRHGRLNLRDQAGLERGYYEVLTNFQRIGTELSAMLRDRPASWVPFSETPLAQWHSGFPYYTFKPSAAGIWCDVEVRTNRFGMRGPEVEQARPEESLRLAVLGASMVAGHGVANDEMFVAFLEERLNARINSSEPQRAEVLNFSVPGYTALEMLVVLEEQVIPFRPDAVFYVAHGDDAERLLHHLVTAVRHDVLPQYEFVRTKVTAADVALGTSGPAVRRRLKSCVDEIHRWLEARVAEVCREQGFLPVWVYAPMPREIDHRADLADRISRAQAAGFVVIDLSDVYGDRDFKELQVAPWDEHPGPEGHRLIAERLFRQLMTRAEFAPLFSSVTDAEEGHAG